MARDVPVSLRAHLSHPGLIVFLSWTTQGGGVAVPDLGWWFCTDVKVKMFLNGLGMCFFFTTPVPAPLPFSPPSFTCFSFLNHAGFPTKGGGSYVPVTDISFCSTCKIPYFPPCPPFSPSLLVSLSSITQGDGVTVQQSRNVPHSVYIYCSF